MKWLTPEQCDAEIECANRIESQLLTEIDGVINTGDEDKIDDLLNRLDKIKRDKEIYLKVKNGDDIGTIIHNR
jgi:hypothetical protein